MQPSPTNVSPPGPIEAPSSQPSLADSSKRLLPWLIAVAFFMESLDTTILNTAVPTIAAALHVAPLSMKSVLASYTLSLAVFIPISGWMADRFGTRRVFASAIGIFTLGSFLCGISSNIHVLVACRILQGCGGAMMVPVGRLTMVRTFAKSELVRAMSFVAIPGFDRSHARTDRGRPDRRIFSLEGYLLRQYSDRPRRFVHGLPASAGLSRDTPIRSMSVGLILFGSGVALLSYVLEVFGEHTLSAREILGLLALSAHPPGGLWISRDENRVSDAASDSVSDSHVSRGGERQLLHSPGHRRHPISLSALVSGWPGVHADSIRLADDAAGDRRHEPEDDDAADSGALRIPCRADFQHGDHRPAHLAFRDHREGHAGVADRGRGVLSTGFSPRCNIPA